MFYLSMVGWEKCPQRQIEKSLFHLANQDYEERGGQKDGKCVCTRRRNRNSISYREYILLLTLKLLKLAMLSVLIKNDCKTLNHP